MRLMVLTGGFPSLSETFIFNKVTELARRGTSVKVVARRRGETGAYRREWSDLPKSLSVRYLPPTQPEPLAAARFPTMLAQAAATHPVEARRWLSHLRGRYGTGGEFVRKAYRLLPFIGERPDVTHIEFATMAEEFGDLLTLLPGRKLISCRGADIDILPHSRPALARSVRDALERADAVHCVSQAMLRSAEAFGLDPGKAFVNYPSIDCRYFAPVERPLRRGPLQVITVARLHWKKGLIDALRALRLAHDQRVRAHYSVIGEGDYREALEFEIRDLGLCDHVSLLGPLPREQVRQALSEADVFLLPSISEGLSNAALEAMSTGLPIVTTDAGGMAEAVRDGVDGFVVRRRNVEAMAARIIDLADSPSQRQQLGASASERVRSRFSLDRQISVFQTAYAALAGDGRLPQQEHERREAPDLCASI